MGKSLKIAIQHLINDNQQVRFDTENSVTQFHCDKIAAMITYDSGADGHYIIKADGRRAWLPILRKPSKEFGVANGGISKVKYVTKLPFQQLPDTTVQADTFG